VLARIVERGSANKPSHRWCAPRLGCFASARGSGFRVQGSGFRVQGSGFRVQGSGYGVQGWGRCTTAQGGHGDAMMADETTYVWSHVVHRGVLRL